MTDSGAVYYAQMAANCEFQADFALIRGSCIDKYRKLGQTESCVSPLTAAALTCPVFGSANMTRNGDGGDYAQAGRQWEQRGVDSSRANTAKKKKKKKL